jgi:hypothetical protein
MYFVNLVKLHSLLSELRKVDERRELLAEALWLGLDDVFTSEVSHAANVHQLTGVKKGTRQEK